MTELETLQKRYDQLKEDHCAGLERSVKLTKDYLEFKHEFKVLQNQLIEKTAMVEQCKNLLTAFDWMDTTGNILAVVSCIDDPIPFELNRKLYHDILKARDSVKTLSPDFADKVLRLARHAKDYIEASDDIKRRKISCKLLKDYESLTPEDIKALGVGE